MTALDARDGKTALHEVELLHDTKSMPAAALRAAGQFLVNVAAHAVRPLTPAVQTLTVVTAPASAGGPDVRIYNLVGHQLGGFLAYDPSFFGGVTLAQHPLFAQNPDVIITGAGPSGGPHTKIWALSNNAVTLQSNFFAFDPAFIGGVFVG